jgi:signal peptidase I
VSRPALDDPGDRGVREPEGTSADSDSPLVDEVATEAPAADEPKHLDRKRPRKRGSFFAELPVLVLVAFVLALLLKTFLIQAFFIPSESMLPTLEVGDRVLVNKLAHDFREPQRGEVIVFSQEDGFPGVEPSSNPLVRVVQALGSGLGFVQSGEKDFIKRIIGMPGEEIEMREGVVYADGNPLYETTQDNGGYLTRPDLMDFGPVQIPEDEYFLMGDNRPNSSDSRSMLGTIPREDVVGRAFAVVWPFDRLSVLSIADYDDEAAEALPPLPEDVGERALVDE